MRLLIVSISLVSSLFFPSLPAAEPIVGTSTQAVAYAMQHGDVDGVWFPKEVAEKLLKEHEAYPHLQEISNLCEQAIGARQNLTAAANQAVDLLSSGLASCEKKLASCLDREDSIWHSPLIQIGSGLAVGLGACAIRR